MGPSISPRRPPVMEDGDRAYGKTEYENGPETAFKIVLNCSGEKAVHKKTLAVKEGMPRRVRDMKNCIELEFSIPVCCQSLVFESVSLEDKMTLGFYRVRDGDTIQVNYVSEGNVAETLCVVDHMKKSYHFIESIQAHLEGRLSPFQDHLITQEVYSEKVNDLPEVYFTPCSSNKAEANRNLFIQCGGLDMLQKLHTLLLRQPWSNMPIKMQYLEHSILRTYWNITAAFTVRLYVLQYPKALENILKSFLRVEINPKGRLTIPMNVHATGVTLSEQNRIACEVVYKAMGSVCNLAEIPECRVQIATYPGVLEQLVAMLMSPSYNSIASLVSMAGMLCLAYSAETHKFLSTSKIVEGVMEACVISRPDYTSEERRRKKLLLLKYFANVLFAQILTTSPYLLSSELKLKIVQFMEEFLEVADYAEIREEEIDNGYKWSTLVPFMKLAYHPCLRTQHTEKESEKSSEDDEELESRIVRCCIQCGIFSLSNVLLSKQTREFFVEEGLLDYTISLPWRFPHHWPEREEAVRLTTFLSQQMQLQPPRLISLAKAKLASMHFGLEKVLRTDSLHQLCAEMYP